MSPPGRPKGEYRSAQHGGYQVNPATPLDHGDIAGLIPHAGRMCLLARVDAWDARTIRCTATGHADADHPLLVSVPLYDPVITRKIGLIRRKGRTLSPAAQQLYAFFSEMKATRGKPQGRRAVS